MLNNPKQDPWQLLGDELHKPFLLCLGGEKSGCKDIS